MIDIPAEDLEYIKEKLAKCQPDQGVSVRAVVAAALVEHAKGKVEESIIEPLREGLKPALEKVEQSGNAARRVILTAKHVAKLITVAPPVKPTPDSGKN